MILHNNLNVILQNNFNIIFQVIFVFQSPYNPEETEIGRHQMIRGDGVKDIAFSVEDCRALFKVSRTK